MDALRLPALCLVAALAVETKVAWTLRTLPSRPQLPALIRTVEKPLAFGPAFTAPGRAMHPGWRILSPAFLAHPGFP